MKTAHPWSWLWLALGALYFLAPLGATLQFSLQAKRGELGFTAYANVLGSPDFVSSFLFSVQTAMVTIVVGALLLVPTVVWVRLRAPRWRPVVEFVTLLPFVVPAVVLVFGLARAYNGTPLTNSAEGLRLLLIGAYVILAFPYLYRAIDTGLRAIDARSLAEAAQSLGAGWPTILAAVIFPNIRVAVLSGAFLTFAIVMGEFTIAALLAQPAFGPYMNLLSSSRVYEPSALAILSFALTWGAIGLIQFLSRGAPGQRHLGGPR